MSHQKQQQENDLVLSGDVYQHFIDGIRSPATRAGYRRSLKRYLSFLKLKVVDDLLPKNPNPRLIESQIISYIMSLRENGIAYATIQYLVAPITTFYQLNDITLNRKKVSRYLGEYKRVAKDGAYTTEQIQAALQNADSRMRMLLLILSSTGCRIGALPTLRLGNLTKIPEGLYRIIFYEGTNNEYYTFTTRETAQTGIDSYLLYRQRCGEKVSFNEKTQRWEPDNTPLIRQQFDINDLLQVKQPKPMKLNAIKDALAVHLVRCGLRTKEHPTAPQSIKRIRKDVSLSKGFRKRAISIFIEAGLNHEIRELIVDHSTQLDQNYFRPTQDQVLQEYLKAEPYLTLDPSIRLAQENQALKQEVTRFDKMQKQIEELNRRMGLS